MLALAIGGRSFIPGLRRGAVVNPAAAAAVAKTQAIAAANTIKAEIHQKSALLAANVERMTAPPLQFGIVPPLKGIDTAYALEHLPEWINSPARDPFTLSPDLMLATAVGPTNSPVASMRLRGVWRQTGGGYAVIDQTVVQAADVYRGLTVLRIEAGAVIFGSPQGPQRLEFPPQGSTETVSKLLPIRPTPGPATVAPSKTAPSKL